MAEASQENTTPDRRIVKRIFRLIRKDSLDEIKEIFETLQPEQRIKVLNYSIHGIIPLYEAVEHKKFGISSYLLELSLLQGPDKMSERWKNCWHPLTAAIIEGNSMLVELILPHLSNIDDNIDGVNTPLIIATFLGNLTAVKLIVAQGADIDRPCFRGRTPLMVSTANSEICSFLLSKNANIFSKDDEGFTAIHLAVAKRHTECVIHLVNAGADGTKQSAEGITPLIYAAMNHDFPALKYLIKQTDCSHLYKIEILEILNACYVCGQKSDITPWIEAIQTRRWTNMRKNCQVPPQGILDSFIEFTTETDLETIKNKPLDLAFQGILVVKRILGRHNRLYMQCLLQTAVIAKNVNNMDKVRQFIDYIEEYCQESSVSIVVANLQYFKSLFYEVGKDCRPKEFFECGAFSIFKMIAQLVVKMWSLVKDDVYANPYFIDSRYCELVDTFLFMMIATKTKNYSQFYLGQFREVVTEVVRKDPRLRLSESLLHHVIRLMKTPPLDSIDFITIILESGADTNSKDCFERPPRRYAVKYVPEEIRSDVLYLLTEYGAEP